MGPYKLRIRIGQHEFEAEGPRDAVEKQFEAFQQLIGSLPLTLTPQQLGNQTPVAQPTPPEGETQKNFDSIFKVEGRVVSLTALPKTDAEAALLVLLGQKLYRNNESATGSELLDGLKQSGYTVGARVVKILDDFIADAMVIKTGKRRGIRYRLTNQGTAKAQAIAKDVINLVA